MAADEKLLGRVRRCVRKRAEATERTLFGCTVFFVNGHLACGVHEHELIVRLAPHTAEAALDSAPVRRFDLSGRRMRGWLLVKVADDRALARWVGASVAYAATLPAK